MSKFQAVRVNSVIVKHLPQERVSTTNSGLILVQDTTSNPTTATVEVVDVGPGEWDSLTSSYNQANVKIGDKVIITLATGIKLDDTHRMVMVDDIFAVVTE